MVTNTATLTGRRWWLALHLTCLLHHKSKSRKYYFSLKKNSTTLRFTYLEERATKMACNVNTSEERRLHALISTKKQRKRRTPNTAPTKAERNRS